jgi:large subunit ribosomal protein L30
VPGKKLKVTLRKSIIGMSPKQEATVRSLGLRRINQTATHDDTETIRWMIHHVQHAVEVSHEA